MIPIIKGQSFLGVHRIIEVALGQAFVLIFAAKSTDYECIMTNLLCFTKPDHLAFYKLFYHDFINEI